MEDKKELTAEEKEAIKKNIQENQIEIDKTLVENSLIDNQLEFEIKGVKYRIKKPSFKEKQEVYKIKSKKFAELIGDKNYMLDKDLRKQYKARGIDIEEMEQRFKNLEREKNDIQYKLGEALVNKASEEELKSLTEEIKKITDMQIDISIEKTNLLDYSIEQQVFSESYSYLLYLIGEKFENDKWVKAWANYEDFQNNDENLVKTFAYYGALIVKDEIQM
jgi:hypothetical protein